MSAAQVAQVKPKVAAAVDRLADELEGLSHRIHDNPELAFREEHAHAWLTEFLERHGARVERGVGGLPTAFRATIPGAGPGPTIAIMAEYDIRISPDGVPGHSREFAEWARSPMARAGMVAGAKALALTALDLLASPDALAKAKEEFTR